MTDEMKEFLVASGLTRQQVSTATAESLVKILMKEDGKELIKEANRQVEQARSLVVAMVERQRKLERQIGEVSKVLLSVSDAQKEYGEVSDKKAKDAVALYGAILTMGIGVGADIADSIRNAGYITYAYLDGTENKDFSMSLDRDVK